MDTAVPLGRLLVTSGLLTQEALDEVLVLQKTDGRRVTELLAEKGLVRRWRNGAVEITLDGILEVTRRRPREPDALSVAKPADRRGAM